MPRRLTSGGGWRSWITGCRDLAAEHDAIAPTCRAARNAVRWAAARPALVPSPAAPLVAAPLTLPTGWRLAAPAELVSGTALIGRSVRFRWPDEVWVRGKVARISRAAGFSLAVAYGPQSALGSLEVVSLLDAARSLRVTARASGGYSSASPSVSGFHFSGTAVMGYRPRRRARCDLVRRLGPGPHDQQSHSSQQYLQLDRTVSRAREMQTQAYSSRCHSELSLAGDAGIATACQSGVMRGRPGPRAAVTAPGPAGCKLSATGRTRTRWQPRLGPGPMDRRAGDWLVLSSS